MQRGAFALSRQAMIPSLPIYTIKPHGDIRA